MSGLTIEHGVIIHGDKRYMAEDCGRVFECLHLEEAVARVDGDRLILQLGGMICSLPVAVAEALLSSAAAYVPLAAADEMAHELRRLREAHERALEAVRQTNDVEKARLIAKLEQETAEEVAAERQRILQEKRAAALATEDGAEASGAEHAPLAPDLEAQRRLVAEAGDGGA
jgi:hypothetical protein